MFDLDKVFETFESPEYGASVNNDFIAKRLQELPLGARKLLAWASLLSGAHSFKLIKRLLSAENIDTDHTGLPLLYDPQEAVAALNAALAAFILQPANNEDRFRFSYVHLWLSTLPFSTC